MRKQKEKKKRGWMRVRHRVVRNVAACVIGPYVKFKYGITVEKFREQGDRQYLIVMNHQTAGDQFFVGMAFAGPVYYIASEDLFSNGMISRLLSWAVAPIPIKKQTTDLTAVMNCLRVAKEGGTIALAPEGNRTYSGELVHIKPSVAKLAKSLKLPVAVLRIEGGYGVQPRWSDVIRKGKMRAYVSRVIEPEEYRSMSAEAFYELLCDALRVDEFTSGAAFHHKRRAEYLERAMYICPDCGFSRFESRGEQIGCTRCGKKIHYRPDLRLEGIGFDFPYSTVAEWYDYQCRFVRGSDPSAYLDKPLYEDAAALSEVILYKKKQKLRKSVTLRLYGDRITVDDDLIFPFDEVLAVTVLGRNKLNIYHGGRVYQLKSDKRFNALRYVNLFYHAKNLSEGTNDGEFLGL